MAESLVEIGSGEGELAAWKALDSQLDDLREQVKALDDAHAKLTLHTGKALVDLRKQIVELDQATHAMLQELLRRVVALEARPLGACVDGRWILGNPPYTGGDEPPAPDTIAVPVATLYRLKRQIVSIGEIRTTGLDLDTLVFLTLQEIDGLLQDEGDE